MANDRDPNTIQKGWSDPKKTGESMERMEKITRMDTSLSGPNGAMESQPSYIHIPVNVLAPHSSYAVQIQPEISMLIRIQIRIRMRVRIPALSELRSSNRKDLPDF